VCALHNASLATIQRIPVRSLKPYWNEELDRLKGDSIFWHNLWLTAGRPLDIRKAFDTVHHYKLYCSLLSYGAPWIIVDVLCNWYSKMFVFTAACYSNDRSWDRMTSVCPSVRLSARNVGER